MDFVDRLSRDKSCVEGVTVESRANILLAKLKMTSQMGGLSVELIFRNSGGSHQPRSEELVRELTDKYPVVRPVYLFLKSMLAKGLIADPSKGGLTSISLLLLIVSIVQDQELTASKLKTVSPRAADSPIPAFTPQTDPFQTQLPTQTNDTLPLTPQSVSLSPGKTLIDFLFWFGHRFNFSEYSVSVGSVREPFSSVYVPRQLPGSTLCVNHPYSPVIVTTKSFKHTEAFREWCKLTLNALYATCACQDLRGSNRHLGVPSIKLGTSKSELVLVKSSHPTLDSFMTLHLKTESKRLIADDTLSQTSTTNPTPRRRKLSSRSQTYEAKGDLPLPTIDITGSDRSVSFLLRKVLICAAFNPVTQLNPVT